MRRNVKRNTTPLIGRQTKKKKAKIIKKQQIEMKASVSAVAVAEAAAIKSIIKNHNA